jgi:protein involved in polysaccharide export with SLBB domain
VLLSRRLLAALLIVAAAGLPDAARAQDQSVYDVSIRTLASRRELTGLVDSLDREIARGSTSGRRRKMLQADVDVQRQRLAIGDMVPGDRIYLHVTTDGARQDSVAAPRDTVVVSPELAVQLPGFPAISMRGVLVSEVETHLRTQITAVIRNARVTAVPLVSIGVLGAVARPGYYFVPITAPVTQVVMIAGGPLGEADPNGIVLQRGGKDRWNRATMTAAAQRQVSLASLGVDDGDVMFISRRSAPLDRTATLGLAGFVLQSVLIVSQLRGN